MHLFRNSHGLLRASFRYDTTDGAFWYGGVNSTGGNFGELAIELTLRDSSGNEGSHTAGSSRITSLDANTLAFQPTPVINGVSTSDQDGITTAGGVTVSLSGENFQRTTEKVTVSYGETSSADTFSATACSITSNTQIECTASAGIP